MDFGSDFFKLEYNKVPPKKGSVLISEPYSEDYFFQRSVVLLIEHDKSGSVGFVLNKNLNKGLKDITDYFGKYNAGINLGGPVSNQNLYYLHKLGYTIEGSVRVKTGLYWGGNFEVIKELASLGKLNDDNIKFFLGYSGWGEGQLESEIKKNFWLVANSPTNEIMSDPDTIWKSALNRMEKKYRIWSNFPVNPESN